jgi:hypothetical protein
MGEPRAFYMWAKRRGGANPDRAGLNRKRQRTGSNFTEITANYYVSAGRAGSAQAGSVRRKQTRKLSHT